MATLPQRKQPPPVPPKSKERLSPVVTIRTKDDTQNVQHQAIPKRPLACNNPFRQKGPASSNHLGPSDVYIGIVGVTGSGKSTLIQRLTGDKSVLIHDSLHSGTREVQSASLKLGGNTIHLVDTPGFNDSEMEDEDVYYLLTDWIKATHEKGRKFSGLLYLHPMNRTREKGSDIRSLKIFKRLVGSGNYDRVVIGMTFLDLEDASTVAAREAQLRSDPGFWGDLIAAGARVIRIEAGRMEVCEAMLADFAGKEAVTLQIEDELCNQGKTAAETDAMSEMPHAEELKLLKLQEEFEEKAQKMVYEERARLMTAFAKEREELENLVFAQQQAKQSSQEEAMLWKSHCEKEQEDYKSLKLQHEQAEEAWQRQSAQLKREVEAKELKEKLDEEKEQREKEIDRRYADHQIRKRHTYVKTQMEFMNRCFKAGTPNQAGVMLNSNLGTSIVLPGVCDICGGVIKICDPFCTLKERGVEEDSRVCVDVCPGCHTKAVDLFPGDKWEVVWMFALLSEPVTCKLEDGIRRTCASCGEACDGVFCHCCDCGCNINLCPKCFAIRGQTCMKRTDHNLRFSFQFDPRFRSSVIRRG